MPEIERLVNTKLASSKLDARAVLSTLLEALIEHDTVARHDVARRSVWEGFQTTLAAVRDSVLALDDADGLILTGVASTLYVLYRRNLEAADRSKAEAQGLLFDLVSECIDMVRGDADRLAVRQAELGSGGHDRGQGG